MITRASSFLMFSVILMNHYEKNITGFEEDKYLLKFSDTCSYQQAGSRKTTEAIARDLIAYPDKTLFLLNGAHRKLTTYQQPTTHSSAFHIAIPTAPITMKLESYS